MLRNKALDTQNPREVKKLGITITSLHKQMIDLEPVEPDSLTGDTLNIMSTAAQIPFDYEDKFNHVVKENSYNEPEVKGIEPFHVSTRSGLSLYF